MVKITAIKNWIKDGCKNGESFDELGIKVKQYLPINDKLNLVARILLSCTVEEGGIWKVDTVYKKFFYEIEMIKAYSNLDFSTIDKFLGNDDEKYSEKLAAYYDDLKQSGLVDIIIGMIDIEEVRFVDECVREQIIENNRVNNSIAGVVGSALNKLVEKLPDEEDMKQIVASLFTGLEQASPETKKFVAAALNWNNGIDVSKVGD